MSRRTERAFINGSTGTHCRVVRSQGPEGMPTFLWTTPSDLSHTGSRFRSEPQCQSGWSACFCEWRRGRLG